MPEKSTRKQSQELIEYKLDSLIETVSKGFAKLDIQYSDMIRRISILENWQAKVDVDLKNIRDDINQRNTASQGGFWNDSLIKIILIIAGALATALTVILSQVGK